MSRAWARWTFLCVLGLGAPGCPDDPLTKLLPLISTEPEALDFGEGIVLRENVLPIDVVNSGTGPLEISEVLVDGPSGVFAVRDFPRVVAAVSRQTMQVVFVPARQKESYSGALRIRSNDPAHPELTVPLAGKGGVQEIEVLPAEIDFGLVNEGTRPRRAVEIQNTGKDVLLVSELVWTSTSVDLTLLPGFRGGRIEALSSTVVELEYSPVDLGADRGTLAVRSNDEDEPEVLVPVRGNANLAPRSVAFGCDKPAAPGAAGCDGVARARTLTAGFRRLVGLEGRDSYDPEGGPITDFRWQLVARPMGSAAAVFHSTEDVRDRRRATGDLEVDRVGRFDLRLITKDQHGLESLDRPEAHVLILPRDLELLLRWDVDTDVDLHVVRPLGQVGDYGTGRVGTSTGSDCASFNRQPNWNDLGTALDDPSLDKDDVSGRGPEIVSLDGPEDGGEYAVFAHYCDSRDRRIPVNVVVEVYVRGERVAQVPPQGAYPLATAELWEAARVTWRAGATPSVEVTDLSATAPRAAPTLCMNR